MQLKAAQRDAEALQNPYTSLAQERDHGWNTATMDPRSLPIRLIAATLIALVVLATGCGSNSDANDVADSTATATAEVAQPSTEPTSEPTVASVATVEAAELEETEAAPEVAAEADTEGPVDITNVVLTNTDANCGTYVGEYASMITDQSTGTDFVGSLVITSDGGGCTFVANSIPSHDVGEGSRFATNVGEVDLNVSITSEPQIATSPTALGMGASVLMLNGIKWEAYPAACFGVGPEQDGREAIGCGADQLENPWRYNIGSPLNNFGFDVWFAHVQPNGLYHYHSTPLALYDIDCDGSASSPVVGFAADGFPVYGPCFTDDTGTIRPAASSYQVKSGERTDVDGYTTPYVTGNVTSSEYTGQFIGDHEYVEGSGDLDKCNGMLVDGQYGYYITGTYPYVLPCYTGTPSTNFR